MRPQTTHEDKDAVHIVMELCAGGELFDSIVEAGNFSERKAAQVFRKMVEVVHHCQELGVMHRDLKVQARCDGKACRPGHRSGLPIAHPRSTSATPVRATRSPRTSS